MTCIVVFRSCSCMGLLGLCFRRYQINVCIFPVETVARTKQARETHLVCRPQLRMACFLASNGHPSPHLNLGSAFLSTRTPVGSLASLSKGPPTTPSMSKRTVSLSPLRSLALLLPVFLSVVYISGNLHYKLPSPVTESYVPLSAAAVHLACCDATSALGEVVLEWRRGDDPSSPLRLPPLNLGASRHYSYAPDGSPQFSEKNAVAHIQELEDCGFRIVGEPMISSSTASERAHLRRVASLG